VTGPPARAAQRVSVVLEGDHAQATPETLAPGVCQVQVTNAGPRPVAVECHVIPEEVLRTGPTHLAFAPFLTGTRLLACQTFRDLFTSETIQETAGLGIRSMTMLFTDLKGSTELYERIGDLQAYALVQRHFERLGRVVRGHGGVLVKTLGDAIMASFLTPLDAVKAAVAMLQDIHRFNEGEGHKQLILKLGIHTGALIAVTLNDRLDYFGQTVNIASRVQGLARADEIVVTEDVYGASGVGEWLQGHVVERQEAQLRGIHRTMAVHAIRVGEGVPGAR
jgi:class 3 adenylate cyclase